MSKDCFLYVFLGFVLINTKLLAFKNDSLKSVKPAKHYFKTIIYADYYTTGKRDLNLENFVSNKLKSYRVS